jgi:CheY-like chemotaxis protein
MAKRPGPGAGRWRLHSTKVHGDTEYNRRSAKKEAEEEIDEALRQYTILVAEDDENLRHNIAEALKDEDYLVITAADGREALRKYREQRPDLLITDVAMPEMDGLILARKVARHIPVIVCTGDVEIYMDRARKYGVREVIEKGRFGCEELCDVVKKVLKEG